MSISACFARNCRIRASLRALSSKTIVALGLGADLDGLAAASSSVSASGRLRCPVQQPRAIGQHRAHRTMRELAWLRSRAKPVGIRTAAAEQATGRDQSPWPLSVGPGRTGYPYPAKSADRRPRATRSSTRSTCMPKQRDVAVDRAQTRAPTDQAPRRPGIHPRKSTSPARLRGSVWA